MRSAGILRSLILTVVVGIGMECMPLIAQQAATGQSPAAPALGELLESEYHLSWVAARTAAARGSQLTVQAEGILAAPEQVPIPVTIVEQGTVKPAGQFTRATLAGGTGRDLTVGEPVLLTRIVALPKADAIVFLLTTVNPPLKAAVAFKFPQGYLELAEPGQLVEVIGQVLAFDAAQDEARKTQLAQAPAGSMPTTTPSPSAAASVKVGQTVEEMQRIMGHPDQMLPLGGKSLYMYKDMTITVTDGKVSQVEKT